ncbi:chitobiase/beta-hexosaminidase C-terminal domain-containing protein [Shewanella salipaludis]|uniref:Uncharacterized protein n=1 Tax=Shewanella salipaludis TaxID=2723052 RepID=A0A972JK01_9GAMM|nr:chitobiase/beta-hexosaminidase C-terminal domain-containing protein [Shewanella salipaludis]NMH64599.1 hypothetical protein [Shewanella salipaludis]
MAYLGRLLTQAIKKIADGRLSLSSAFPNASMEYRIDDGPWTAYGSSVTVAAPAGISARTRISSAAMAGTKAKVRYSRSSHWTRPRAARD